MNKLNLGLAILMLLILIGCNNDNDPSEPLPIILSEDSGVVINEEKGQTPNDNKDIVGLWERVGEFVTIEFFEDGTVIFSDQGESLVADYRFLDEGRLRIDMPEGALAPNILLYDDELSFSFSDDEKWVFQKAIPIEERGKQTYTQVLGKWEMVGEFTNFEFFPNGVLTVEDEFGVSNRQYRFVDHQRIQLELQDGVAVMGVQIFEDEILLTDVAQGQIRLQRPQDLSERGGEIYEDLLGQWVVSGTTTNYEFFPEGYYQISDENLNEQRKYRFIDETTMQLQFPDGRVAIFNLSKMSDNEILFSGSDVTLNLARILSVREWVENTDLIIAFTKSNDNMLYFADETRLQEVFPVNAKQNDKIYLSPNGTQIAYLDSNDNLNLVDVFGENIRSIGHFTFNSWSPDSSKILVYSGDLYDGFVELYIYDVFSNVLTPIGKSSSLGVHIPTFSVYNSNFADWSPDSTKISFPDEPGMVQLNVAYADGSRTDNIVSSHYETLANVQILNPVWSPDGSKISFWGRRVESTNPGLDDRFDGRVYVINNDGSNLRVIYDQYADMNISMAWSPDSNYLIFRGPMHESSVLVAEIESGNVQNLSNLNKSWINDPGMMALTWHPSLQNEDELYNITPEILKADVSKDGSQIVYQQDWGVERFERVYVWDQVSQDFETLLDLDSQIINLLGLVNTP